MARVYLGLGSNIERERYIAAGLDALEDLFGEMELSPVYESAAIGFDGTAFYNMAVGVNTDLPLAEMAKKLRDIEYEHGRPLNASRFSSRQLDIDILTYDDLVGVIDGVELPRGEILENAFVLQPLADVAPEVLHPESLRPYQELLAEMDMTGQPLIRIDLTWRGRPLGR